MRDKYNIDLDADHLLSIFAGTDIRHPYRFQPNVRIYVPFEEYVKFVKNIVKTNLRLLTFPLDLYERALNNANSETLVNLYYVDLSKAITSELCMACLYGKDCTEICHDFSLTVDRRDFGQIKELFDKVSLEDVTKAANYVREDLNSRLRTVTLSEHNTHMFYYAVLLRSFSFNKSPIKFNVR